MPTFVCVCVCVCVIAVNVCFHWKCNTHRQTYTLVPVMLQSVTYASTGLSISHWLHLAGQGRFYFLPHIRNATQVYPSFYPFNSWRYFRFAQATLVKVKDYLHLILKVIKRGALPTYPPAFFSQRHTQTWVCTRPFQWSSSSQGIPWGMETTGKIRQIEVT